MTTTTALAAFFLIWWVTLFAVLPWGVRSQHESEDVVPGTDPGAPTSFRLGRVLLRTTVVSLVIFAVSAAIYRQHWITIQDLMGPFDFTK